MEKKITSTTHPVSYILSLEQEVIDNQPGRLSPADIEDVSDNYQEQRELIQDLISKLTPQQLLWYKSFTDSE